VTNPLTVIEQFTYLIFIKSLDDKQLQSETEANLLGLEPKIVFDKDHENLICHNFKEFEAQKMYDTVQWRLNLEYFYQLHKYYQLDIDSMEQYIERFMKKTKDIVESLLRVNYKQKRVYSVG